jgi:hypothetical protein
MKDGDIKIYRHYFFQTESGFEDHQPGLNVTKRLILVNGIGEK